MAECSLSSNVHNLIMYEKCEFYKPLNDTPQYLLFSTHILLIFILHTQALIIYHFSLYVKTQIVLGNVTNEVKQIILFQGGNFVGFFYIYFNYFSVIFLVKLKSSLLIFLTMFSILYITKMFACI